MRTLLIIFTVALAVTAAGCGGSSSPNVADVGSGSGGTTTTPTDGGPSSGSGPSQAGGGSSGPKLSVVLNAKNATQLASCMRKNGVPNFPDPSKNGSIQFGSANGIDPNSPKFKAAMEKCRKLLPNGGAPTPQQQAKAQQAALALSRCMRAHGVKNFPDPTFQGGKVTLGIRGNPGNGLDPKSPTFRRAQQACFGQLNKGGPGPVTSGG